MTTQTRTWWVVEEGELRRILRRVEDGDDPAVVMVEEYAIAEHHYPEDD